MTTEALRQPQILNPYVTYDAESKLSSNTLWKRVWQVAALVTAVAFIALASVAVMYTSLYIPEHLALVSILTLAGGMPVSYRVFQRLWDNKEYYQYEAQVDAKLVQFEKKFVQNPDEKICNLGVKPDMAAEKLKALYARFCYFAEEAEEHEKLALELQVDAKNLKDVDFSNPAEIKQYQKLQTIRGYIQMCRSQGAINILQSAYVLHLMENPYETRKISDFFNYAPLLYSQRAIASDHADSSHNLFIQTPQRKYSIDEILKAGPQQLKDWIFSGKQPGMMQKIFG